MARKSRYTKKQIAHALEKSNGLISVAARLLKCEQQTVRNYIARYPELADILTDKRNTFIDLAEAKLVEQVKAGQPWAIQLVLKTLGKDRGYVERQEISHSEEKPFKIYIQTSEFNPDDA